MLRGPSGGGGAEAKDDNGATPVAGGLEFAHPSGLRVVVPVG